MASAIPALGEAEGPMIAAPQSMSELGVPRSAVQELALKLIHSAVPENLRNLAIEMHLPYALAHDIYQQLRGEQLAEITGMQGNIPKIRLTAAGRARALEHLAANHYVGAVPVSFQRYTEQVKQQALRGIQVHREDVVRAFSHLVLEEQMITQIGTALNSGSAVLMYGPPGEGKTAMATTLSRVLSDKFVWIPFALYLDGQIISVFDPNIHRRAEGVSNEEGDARWVCCERPAVIVAGELTNDMLELQMNSSTGFYDAPLQVKANNGVLVVDDFGRQRMRPEELLNRWVYPLERGVDFLTLAGGRKIPVPFDLLVVFATNLNPLQLGDEAFLRRLQTKIQVPPISPQRFTEICSRLCRQREIPCEPEIIEEMIEIIQVHKRHPLRACHPRDILYQIGWAAAYANRPSVLDHDSLVAATDLYFVAVDGNSDSAQPSFCGTAGADLFATAPRPIVPRPNQERHSFTQERRG
jgi:MoxR-like ATPase